jgi:hypothetical protein
MRLATRYQAAVLWAGVAAVAAAGPAMAQAPPYPPPPPPVAAAPAASSEAAEIAHCLCLGQAVITLSADMTAKQRAYDAVRDELARLDAQLQTARAGMNVDNPQSVAQFRQLLEQRDAAFKRSTGVVTGDLSSATERYNARAGEFNSRCANRPRNPDLLSTVQATLSCPPLY